MYKSKISSFSWLGKGATKITMHGMSIMEDLIAEQSGLDEVNQRTMVERLSLCLMALI